MGASIFGNAIDRLDDVIRDNSDYLKTIVNDLENAGPEQEPRLINERVAVEILLELLEEDRVKLIEQLNRSQGRAASVRGIQKVLMIYDEKSF